jgi:hypothetical protein
MQVACRRCGYPVPSEQRECQSCGEDNGFPNVRLAEIPREIAALAQRVLDAEVSSDARNCRDVLERFGTAVQSSQAIIARSLAVIQDLIESDLRTYTSFQRQLAAGMRVAEDNEADRVRTQVEAALYPNFHTEIRFAFLSIGPAGLAAYGAYAMVLKNAMIEHRATVFEENLLTLGKRLRLLLTEPIPAGYRATWARRDSLAKAKLHMMLGTKRQMPISHPYWLRTTGVPVVATLLRSTCLGR